MHRRNLHSKFSSIILDVENHIWHLLCRIAAGENSFIVCDLFLKKCQQENFWKNNLAAMGDIFQLNSNLPSIVFPYFNWIFSYINIRAASLITYFR